MPTKKPITMISMSAFIPQRKSVGSRYRLRKHHHKRDEGGYLFTSRHIGVCWLLFPYRERITELCRLLANYAFLYRFGLKRTLYCAWLL